MPLPFVSYGGSNLLTALAGTGMLLRIAREKGGAS
ncbi:MAG TPA: FtsW/RodA/SpoVE family cell cycle protein [Myxococcota bacterium]|nr:FtsW/RodA/SpoVE family cell cycle protein [Myxococcota bacterium]